MKGKKNNFDNSIPKDGVDHEVNVRHRHDIGMASYTDILPNYLSKFHKYGSYNFFPRGRPHLAFVHFYLTPLAP